MTNQTQATHQLASRAATQFVKGAVDAGLSWSDIAIGGETIITIVIAAMAQLSNTPDSERFAQEMIETMTEHAHKRVQAYLRGVPYEG